MSNNERKNYTLDQSPFYRLSSKKRLTHILKIPQEELKKLTQADTLYIEREITGKNGKKRNIEIPDPRLKQVQKRIATLFSRVETPGFLFCPAEERSYIGNAKEHVSNAVVRSLDIQAYFASTSSRRVYWCFHEQMKCAPDIAGILTALSTLKGRLPTGSPLSPMLSYYAHIDMWDAISTITREANCTLTVYMDDLTVSGANVPDRVMWQIKQQIHRCNLRYHKEKYYTGQIREVTGVIIRNHELKLANRQHLKIHQLRQQISRESDSKQRAKLSQQLQGCIAQAQQITASNQTY